MNIRKQQSLIVQAEESNLYLMDNKNKNESKQTFQTTTKETIQDEVRSLIAESESFVWTDLFTDDKTKIKSNVDWKRKCQLLKTAIKWEFRSKETI